MYAALYDRLSAWLLLTVGMFGLLSGHMGNYMYLSPFETAVYLTIAALGLFGARSRKRDAVFTSAVLGTVLTLWGLLGFTIPVWIGSPDPLENILRIIVGGWGITVTVLDTLTWRESNIPS